MRSILSLSSVLKVYNLIYVKVIIEKLKNSFIYMKDCCKKQNLWELLFPLQPELKAHSSPIRAQILLGIRVYSWMHLTAILIYDFTILNSPISKFLYLTNIAYLLSWLYFTFVQHNIMPNLAKGLDLYAEVIFEVSFCLEWLVTLAYWGVLKQDSYAGLDFFWSFNAHGIVLLLMLLDFVFNCYRFIYTQYIAFVVVSAVYLLVLNFPYALTVQPVYGRAMNWVSWETYVFIFAAFLGSVIVYFISRQIYVRFKEKKLQKVAENCQNKPIQNKQTGNVKPSMENFQSINFENTATKAFSQ